MIRGVIGIHGKNVEEAAAMEFKFEHMLVWIISWKESLVKDNTMKNESVLRENVSY